MRKLKRIPTPMMMSTVPLLVPLIRSGQEVNARIAREYLEALDRKLRKGGASKTFTIPSIHTLLDWFSTPQFMDWFWKQVKDLLRIEPDDTRIDLMLDNLYRRGMKGSSFFSKMWLEINGIYKPLGNVTNNLNVEGEVVTINGREQIVNITQLPGLSDEEIELVSMFRIQRAIIRGELKEYPDENASSELRKMYEKLKQDQVDEKFDIQQSISRLISEQDNLTMEEKSNVIVRIENDIYSGDDLLD